MTSSHFLGFLKVLSVCSSSIFGFVEPRSHIYLALGTKVLFRSSPFFFSLHACPFAHLFDLRLEKERKRLLRRLLELCLIPKTN